MSDPVEWVTTQARDLAMRAIEAGWSGPPFDPAALADLLRIPVRPSQDVLDARLVPTASGVRIDFNPNRSPGRIRFSIAHEVAHVLFPDHATAARHRLAGTPGTNDADLELLCNLAASELVMPIGSFTELADGPPSIDTALRLRSAFDLSMEAVLLRVARVARVPVTAFAAAPLADLSAAGYRVDYAIASRPHDRVVARGLRVPRESVVGQCTAIGYTAKGVERWGRRASSIRVEAVGLPPYPGQSLPRVAGLLLPTTKARAEPGLNYLVGDATQPRGSGPRFITHVVNDATTRWGGAFARDLARRWPALQASFTAWASGSPPRLGAVHVAEAEPGLWVASLVAQHGYGPSAKPRIRYAYLEAGLESVAAAAAARGASVHAPRLGAGQAGGRWEVIAELLERALVDRGLAVTVYDLPSSGGPSTDSAGPRQLALPVSSGS